MFVVGQYSIDIIRSHFGSSRPLVIFSVAMSVKDVKDYPFSLGNLDVANKFYHGGCRELTKVNTLLSFQSGSLFLYMPAKEQRMPLQSASRHCTYELTGKNSNEQVSPGSLVTGFHRTKLSSLFGTTRLQAWPYQSAQTYQCDGAT